MKNQPIRIIHYIGSLNSGGSQSMIMNIYRNIDKTKIQFDFIIDRKNELLYKKEIELLGGKVYIFDNYFKGFNFLSFIKQWDNFFSIHPEYKIIHCHVRSVASIVLKIAKKHELVTICHSHSTSNGKGLISKVKEILQKSIPKYSDYMLACSKESAKWLYGNSSLNDSRCIIINNAVDRNLFKYNNKYRKQIRDKYNIKDNNIVIGHVGRFEEVKNHKFIIKLALSILKENRNYIFMLCGDGTLKEKIKAEIENSKYCDNFIFVETTNEIYKYYNSFDLFILPSVYEGLGMVLIEAQFNGLYCIASNAIPNEANISNFFVKKELDVELWKNEIYNCASDKCKNRKNIIYDYLSNDYDIKTQLEKINNLYSGDYRNMKRG